MRKRIGWFIGLSLALLAACVGVGDPKMSDTPRAFQEFPTLLRDLCEIWAALPVPAVNDVVGFAEGSNDEFAEVAQRYGGKRWNEVDRSCVSSGYATLLLMETSGRAYYCGSYLHYGLEDVISDPAEGERYWNGIDLLEFAADVVGGHSQRALFTGPQAQVVDRIFACFEQCRGPSG